MNENDLTTAVLEWSVAYATGSSDAPSAERFSLAIQVSRVVACAVWISSIWILLCMAIYGCKTNKWTKKPGSSNLDQGMMYSCCVAAVALSLPRISFTCVLLLLPAETLSPTCEILMDASNGLYVVATYPAYFFLWLRQRAIYCHPAAQRLAGKCVVISGWILLLVLTALSAGLAWIFIAPPSYTSNHAGCIIDAKAEVLSAKYYELAGLFIASQLSLLAFFIYPMVRCGLDQINNRRRSSCKPLVTRDENELTLCNRFSRSFLTCRMILTGYGERKSDKTLSLGRTIRRSVCSTVIAILSDFTVMVVVTFAMAKDTPRLITDSLYDVSVLINTLCILATFGDVRKILTLCRPHSDEMTTHRRKSQDTTQSNFIQSGDGAHN